jgi:DNA polymerase III epsilon subunit family exonuclease
MSRIIFWDFETTGLNPYHDQIIEIAAEDNYGRRFEYLVQLEHGKFLSSKVKEITGITEHMLEDQPLLTVVLDEFLDFIRGADYMVGHNSIRFDCLFLKAAIARYNKNFDLNTIRQLDTMLVYQYYYSGINSFALGSLCKYFNIKHNNAHRALGDVLATKALLERALQTREADVNTMYTKITTGSR